MSASTFIRCMFFAALVASAAHAQEQVSTTSTELTSADDVTFTNWQSRWKIFMGGIDSQQGKDQGAAAMLRLRGKFDFTLVPTLDVHLEPVADLFAGRVEERFDDDSYQSKIWLRDTYLNYHPFAFVELHGGAIGQQYLCVDEDHENSLLVSHSRAFPGLQEILQTTLAPVRLRLIAEQTIPTSYSLNVQRTDREALPHFDTQSLHAYGDHFHGDLKWNAMFGHYSWRDIPDSVAFDSEIVGNSRGNDAEAAPGARLAYALNGFMWGWDADYRFVPSLGVELSYQGIINSDAPAAAGHGQSWTFGPRYYFGDQSLGLSYTNYFIESDATLNVYGHSSWGYGNRVGDYFQLDWDTKHFTIVGRYVNARPIAENNTQQVWNYFELGVDTKYAPF